MRLSPRAVALAPLVALALGLVAPGCKKSAEPQVTPVSPNGAPAAPNGPAAPGPGTEPGAAPGKDAATSNALASAGFLSVVPGDAIGLVAASGIGALGPKLGLDAVATAIRGFLETSGGRVGPGELIILGALDPARWAEVGLDANKPVGVALLEARSRAFALYVGVKDPVAFEAALQKLATLSRDTLTIRKVETATVYEANRARGVALVVRDGWAALVGTARRADIATIADRIATLRPAHSASADRPYDAAFVGLEGGEDVAAWLDLKTISRLLAERVARFDSEEKAGEAVPAPTGDAPDAFDHDWERRRHARDKAESAFILSAITGIDAVAVAGDLRTDGPVGAVAFLTSGENAVIKAFAAGAPGFGIYRGVTAQPTLLLAGRVDVARAWAVVQQAITAAGAARDLDGFKRDLKKELSLDLDVDLISVLSGEGGLLLTGGLDADDAPERHFPFGGAFAVGLKDPAAGQKLIDTVFTTPALARMAKPAPEVRGYELTVPDMGTVWVAVRNGQIVFALSKDVFDALGAEKPATADVGKPALTALLARDGVAGAFVLDPGVFGQLLFRGKRVATAVYTEAKAVHAGTPGADAPPEAAAVAREKKIADLEAQLDVLRDKEDEAMLAHLTVITKAIGPIGLVAEPTAKGLTIRGGLYVGAPSLKDAVKTITDEALALAKNDGREQRRALYDEIDKLRNQANEAPAEAPALVAPMPVEAVPVEPAPAAPGAAVAP